MRRCIPYLAISMALLSFASGNLQPRQTQKTARANKRSGRRSKNIAQRCCSATFQRSKKSGLMITFL